jgi:hypothetical protein
MEIKKEVQEKFVEEYNNLTEKHGVQIFAVPVWRLAENGTDWTLAIQMQLRNNEDEKEEKQENKGK